jgi:hypothetical protein
MPYPEFSQQRLRLEFIHGFSSVPYLASRPDTAADSSNLSVKTRTLIRLIENIQADRFSTPLRLALGEPIDGVFIDGGDSVNVDIEAIADKTGIPVWLGRGGRYAGETGGRLILQELGLQGMICDLGQTGLKISWAGQRWAFERDLNVLPIRKDKASLQEKGAQRRALRQFMAAAIRQAVDEAGEGAPEALVCALPSSLDRWGQPRGSSYCGMTNDTQLLPDSLELAGWNAGHIILLNDAELAAVSALQDERLQACNLALVLTLGYAIGAAKLDLVHQAAVTAEA